MAIYISRHTEIQYFNPLTLGTRHTSTYLPQTLPPDHDTLDLREPQYLKRLFQLGNGSRQQSCTTVFFISFFLPL